ncbi:MAG TPA: winged helix-turn-helix domain-containing protein [Nitrospiria bacterium]|nr:winged helix-turn-helix domain-containing protein [Nitrospiria bacterium]
MEALKDISDGLEQRINAYKNRLQELQKKRERIDDEIKTIKRYLELAETLYRVEADKAKIANLSKQLIAGTEKDSSLQQQVPPLVDVTDQSRESREILMGRSKYVGMSVSQAASLLLAEVNAPMHAKEIHQKLIEGGLRMRGKTPVTSIAISLARDKRFKKVAPNTFMAVSTEDSAIVNTSEHFQGKGVI